MRHVSVLRLCVTSFSITPLILSAQQDTVRLRPVVVTATRVPVSADVVAAAVTVLTGAELQARGIRTVADALRTIPAVTVVETGSVGGLTSLYVRGGENDYVKVLLDGIPLNQPGGTIDFANLTMDNIDRIEIVRGPASVLYGSDAVTGVIQIFTRTGHGRPTVTATVRGGLGERYDKAEAATSVSYDVEAQGAAGTVAYSLAASTLRTPGWYSFNSDYRNTVLSGRVRMAPDPRTDASLSYRLGDARYHFPTDFAGRPVDSTQESFERGPTFAFEAGRRLSDRVEARVVAGLRELRQGYRNPPDESRDLVRRETAGALLHWRGGAGTVFTAGAEYEEESQSGSFAARRTNAAYYGQALVGTDRPVTVTLGARLEDNSAFGTHVTYRGGARWRPDDATGIYASLGTAFKEPLLIENYGHAGFGIVGNLDLVPERSTSWEVGVERAVPETPLTVAVAYFDQAFRDMIVFDFGRTPNYANVAAVNARGVELEGRAAGGPWFARLAYAYVKTRVRQGGGSDFESGRRLLRRPDHRAEARIGRFIGGGSVSAEARFVGDRDDIDFTTSQRITLHPFARVALTADYEVLRPRGPLPGLGITVRLENATNDPAREIVNYPARGRTLSVEGRLAR